MRDATNLHVALVSSIRACLSMLAADFLHEWWAVERGAHTRGRGGCLEEEEPDQPQRGAGPSNHASRRSHLAVAEARQMTQVLLDFRERLREAPLRDAEGEITAGFL